MRTLALVPALLALLVAGAAAAPTDAAPTPTAGSACPSLLTLLNAMPDSSLFADILESLGSKPQPVVAEPPLPPPGSGGGSTQLTLSRRLAQEQPAAEAAKPGNPVACPAIFDPVCGADNATYGNACAAGAAGAVVACKGECPCAGSSGDAGACIDLLDPVCGAGEPSGAASAVHGVQGGWRGLGKLGWLGHMSWPRCMSSALRTTHPLPTAAAPPHRRAQLHKRLLRPGGGRRHQLPGRLPLPR